MAKLNSIQMRRSNKEKTRFSGLISIINILLLVLVFMLKGQNHSGLVTNVAKNIQLPKSKFITINSKGVVIQVSTSQIWVDDLEVVNSDNLKPSQIFDKSGKIIIPLLKHLSDIRRRIEASGKFSQKAKPFSGIIHLVVDKSLKYSYLKKIIHSCESAGYKNVKFIAAVNE